jgi:methylated-DNA-[protein]-cysteine S-methyltransferase
MVPMTPPASASHIVHPSPVGDILIAAFGERLVALHPVHDDLHGTLAALAHRLDEPLIAETTDAAQRAADQLEEYFAGERERFDLDLDWRLVRGFTRRALEAVCEIPYGETAGYGEVAAIAGSPRASRAVGTACAQTPFSIVVPVHRVIRADGSLGEYGGHPEVKRFLIDLEDRHAALPAAR